MVEGGKLGVALHGAGWVAHAHAASWSKNPLVEVVSVSDVDRGRAERLIADCGLGAAARDDYDEVLRDDRIDVVDVCSPSHLHAEHGIAAAAAGKHVLVEKPMALDMDENRALRDAVAKAGVNSLVSFVARFNPEVQTIKSLLDAEAIGEVFYAELDYWHSIRPSHHAWDLHRKKRTGGSAMLLGGCHAVDAIRWLVGREVVEVTALGNNTKGLFEYDANVVAMLRFAGGTIGKVSTLFDAEMPYTFNIDLAGTEGTVRDNRLWSKRMLPGQTDWATVPTVLLDSTDVSHHPFDAEIDHFVDCILGNRPPHCNVADAFHSHELCMAIDRSIELGGRPVSLPLE